MESFLWWAGTVVVIGGLALLAYRVEPHWVAKDGSRFTCRIRELSETSSSPISRWRDRHVIVEGDRLRIGGRATVRTVASGDYGNLGLPIRVVGRATDAPRRFAVYLLDSDPPAALRVPAESRATAILDGLVRPV